MIPIQEIKRYITHEKQHEKHKTFYHAKLSDLIPGTWHTSTSSNFRHSSTML